MSVDKIQRFEDFIAWQKARKLTKDLYQWSKNGEVARDFGFRDQIRRLAVSIMANIAEGYERGGAGEFHHFLSIAKASCAEVRSHLYVALDAGYIEQGKFELLMANAEEVGKITGGLRMSVQRKR